MQQEDIHSLNLHSLLVLRDCAQKDPSVACYRFGCEPSFVQEICGMSMESIGALAQTDTLLFALRYRHEDLQKAQKANPQFRALLLEGFNRATAG